MKKNTILSTVIAASLLAGSAGAFAQDRDHRRDGPPDRHDMRRDMRDERGAGPEHNWHRGDRLPAEYRHRNYVVDDWRGHHLDAPPRGYHWVQSGGDYVLAAIATGVILKMVLDR